MNYDDGGVGRRVVWTAVVVATLGVVVALVIVTVNIAKSHELDPPAITVLSPLPAGAQVAATLRECPVTGNTCRLVAVIDQPDGDAVATLTQAMTANGWPLVTGTGGISTGCHSQRLCAKVWPFAYYADTFGLPSGLDVSIDALEEVRGHGALVVITKTS